MNYDEASLLAEEVYAVFTPMCRKILACGSYRRVKEIINDLDFVAVPKSGIDFVNEAIKWSDGVLSSGPRKTSIIKHDRQIDFLITTMNSFWPAVLHFTGSKEFNIMCRKRAKMRTWKLNEYGLFDAQGNQIGKSEQGILETLSLKNFYDPKSRSLEERSTYQPNIDEVRYQEERRRRLS